MSPLCVFLAPRGMYSIRERQVCIEFQFWDGTGNFACAPIYAMVGPHIQFFQIFSKKTPNCWLKPEKRHYIPLRRLYSLIYERIMLLFAAFSLDPLPSRTKMNMKLGITQLIKVNLISCYQLTDISWC